MLNQLLALITKEFLALLKDKRSRMVLIGPPIAQLLIFGYAATFDLDRVPFAIFDEDRSIASMALVDRFTGSTTFDEVARIDNDAAIAPLIDSRQALLVLHLGPDFAADLRSGRTAPVQLILDGRNSNTALLALNDANNILLRFAEDWLHQQGQRAPPAHLELRSLYNENLLSRWFIVPGIVALLTLVVALLVTSLSVAREREGGTFDQLLVTPLRPVQILIGKAVPGLIIGLIEASVIIIVAVLWFEVPLRGSLGALYLGLVLYLLATIGIGLMISSLSVTQQQALLGAFLFLVPAVILSGFATPIANMPEAVQWLTQLNPMRYFLIIVRGVFLEGDGFILLADQFWPMAVIAVVTLSAAGWLFRHRMT